jgi:hypothetical protein
MDITKPNEQRHQDQNGFTWEQFAKDCLLNKYVLVIGSEAIFNRGINPEAEGNSMKLLLNMTIKELAQSIPIFNGMENRLSSICKNFTDLFRQGIDKDSIKTAVLNVISHNKFDQIFETGIEPGVMHLLGTRCFPVVITTAIDPFIEIAMEKVWGKDNFEIIEIENGDQTKKPYNEFGVSRPVLCYAFGKANPSQRNNKFVLSENDAMERISNWFKNYNTGEFLKYIQGFQILSIGNQFDDWMFRFFWFLLRGEAGKHFNGQQVAVEIKENDHSLANYLSHENVKIFPNAREFMWTAYGYIKKTCHVIPQRSQGVFISYAHEDRYIALPLAKRLEEKGCSIWIDERLEGGAEYDNRIRNAINDSAIFMPILSAQTKNDIINQIPDRYYRKEWEWAQEHKNLHEKVGLKFKTIPIIVGDFQIDKYSQQLPTFISKSTVFELAKKSIEELVDIIKGKKERL